jgi:DNA-binding IclR family transcriptional regulator
MSVPGLERGVAILRLFRRDRPLLTPPQIAAELSIPRSTIHRLLAELCGLGLVRRDANGRYGLDAGVLSLGYEYLASLDIVEVAGPVLEALRNETNWSTHLAVRQGRSIVYLSRFASRAAVTRNVAVGSSLPAHATLMGRLLLSDLEPTALRELYRGVELDAVSAQTPRTLVDLERLIAQDRERGHVASGGFYEPGVRAVAAPVRDASLMMVGAINATAVEGDGVAMEAVVGMTVTAAQRISRLLGDPEPASRARTMTGDTPWL